MTTYYLRRLEQNKKRNQHSHGWLFIGPKQPATDVARIRLEDAVLGALAPHPTIAAHQSLTGHLDEKY